MGYKQGIVLGSSVAMLIFSIILLVFYIGCSGSGSCKYESASFYSPIWTSLLGMAIAFLGIGMSVSKTEKKWGGCFLALCIICIFIAIGCTILTLTAFFFEILDTDVQSPLPPPPPPPDGSSTASSQPSLSSSSSQPPLPSSSSNRDVAASLWLCMMGTAFVMMIISIVASCMFCCCQEPQQSAVTETHLVLTNGIPAVAGQSIIVNNQQFVLQPAAPGTTIITTGALPAGSGDGPPPYSTVVNQGLQGPYPAASGASLQPPTSGPYQQAFATNNARTQSTAPPHEYMQLQHTTPNTEQHQNPTAATTSSPATDSLQYLIPSHASTTPTTGTTQEEYSYIDTIDSSAERGRLPTPEEFYDDIEIAHVTGRQQQNTDDLTYTYASTANVTSTPSRLMAGENGQYVNNGVQRPAAERHSPRPAPKASTPEYLDVLP